MKENFCDLSEEELKAYSASLSEYKSKFSEYIAQYYTILMDKFSFELNDRGKLTYKQIFEMVDYIDNLKGGNTKRNVTFEE